MDQMVGLYHIFRSCLEMFYDRGYNVPYLLDDGSDERIPRTQKRNMEWFYETFKNRGSLTSLFRHSKTHKCTYLMFEQGDIGKPQLSSLISRFSEDITQCVFVFSSVPKPFAKKVLYEMNTDPSNKVRLEWFLEDELLINYIGRRNTHVEVVTNEETKNKLLKLGKIPTGATTDWEARYLGARIGDIIKITRKSESAGRYTNYRLIKYQEELELPKETPVKRRV